MEGRRKFFKFAGIGAALAGLGTAIAWKAHAHGRFGHGPIDPQRLEEGIGRMLRHFYVEIDATEAQKQKLDPIVRQAARDLLPLREKFHAGRHRALELLAAPAVDRGALEGLRGEHLQLAEDGSRRLTQAVADVAEALTPDQRRVLAERVQRHRRGWGHG
jgi:periplasmic protein CpxP/Spy